VTDLLFPIGDYTAALLRPDQDTAALQALFEACADFSDLVEGEPPAPTAAQDAFTDLPPGKTLDDKFLIGVFDPAGILVGVLDVIRAYPQPAAWFIGLLLLHPSSRGHGLGEIVCRAFEGWAAAQGAREIGLAVVEANVSGYRFWSRLGFVPIRTTPPRVFGRKTHAVIYMARSL
jgi:GNAT superfamily N-acetyltransferase